ncbi:MAG: NAD(P)/FAD-dependent oxidoreductase [Chloroflexota bacterium]
MAIATQTQEYDVVIIGAGQAGLVQGYHLQQAGINFVILEANDSAGGSWHHYWDSVRLFSSAEYSSLDGLPFPADADYYPEREDVIAYLQQYAAHFDLPIHTKTRVERIDKDADIFQIHTNQGMYHARAVIAATGPFTAPHMPKFAGDDMFQGKRIHSLHYTNADAYHGQRIVVIGSNNSAVQIACELATVADVSMATRKDIQWAPQRLWGKNIFFWLHRTGFDMMPVGCHFNLCKNDSVYDDGTYEAMVKSGNPDPRPMFQRITEQGVVWADGTEEPVDTILYATGFERRTTPFLASLGALDDKHIPQEHKGVSTVVDGLFYVGLEGQIAPASATIRGVSRDARYVADAVEDYLETQQIVALQIS